MKLVRARRLEDVQVGGEDDFGRGPFGRGPHRRRGGRPGFPRARRMGEPGGGMGPGRGMRAGGGFRRGMADRRGGQSGYESDDESVDLEPMEETAGPLRPGERAPRYSPPARLGPNMRIQASVGHRAAVVELRPGLYVVAEVPAALANRQAEMAVALAPMILTAVTRAITHPYRMLLPGQGGGTDSTALLARAVEQGVRALAQPRPERHAHRQPLPPPPPRRALPPGPPWVDEDQDELEGLFGCEGNPYCPCRWRTP